MDDAGWSLTDISSDTISNHSSPELPPHARQHRRAQEQEDPRPANEDAALPDATEHGRREPSIADSDVLSELRSSLFGDIEDVMDGPQSPPLTRGRRALAAKKMPMDNYRDRARPDLGLDIIDTSSDTVGPYSSPQLPLHRPQGALDQYQWAWERAEEDVDLWAEAGKAKPLPAHLSGNHLALHEAAMNHVRHQPQPDSDLARELQKAKKSTEKRMAGLGIAPRPAASQSASGEQNRRDTAGGRFVVQQNGSSSSIIGFTDEDPQSEGTESTNIESEDEDSDDFDQESAFHDEVRYEYPDYRDLTEEELAFLGEEMLKQSDLEMRGRSQSLDSFLGFPEELEPDPLATINSYFTGPQERRPTKPKSQYVVVDLTSSPQWSPEPESIPENFYSESYPEHCEVGNEEFCELINDSAYAPLPSYGDPIDGVNVSLSTAITSQVIEPALNDLDRKVIQPSTDTAIPVVRHSTNESALDVDAPPKVVIGRSSPAGHNLSQASSNVVVLGISPSTAQELSQVSSNVVVIGSSPPPAEEFSDDAMDLDESNDEDPLLKGSLAQPVPPVSLGGPAPASTKEKPKLKSTYKKEPYRTKPADMRFSQQPQQRRAQSLRGPVESDAWKQRELSTYNGHPLPPRPALSSPALVYHTYLPQPPVLHYQPHGPDGLGIMSPVGIDSASRSRGRPSGGGSSNDRRGQGFASTNRGGIYPTAFNPHINALVGSPTRSPMRHSFSSAEMVSYPTMSMNSSPASTAGGLAFTQRRSGGRSKKVNEPNPPSVQPNPRSVQSNPPSIQQNPPPAREYVTVQFNNTANLHTAHIILSNAGGDRVYISVSGLTLRVVRPGGSGVRPWVRGLVPMGRITHSGMC